ncbi:Flp family type IVb pilin [Novosphingobium sp. B 225]|uniref:Flp family type IVb pilin n=1 Tax=Novosphingobium sp. B 225 TaxID=1961849 RepID=UPI000B4ABC58|nr:Flp family type IVb pilin [Novosphingobium sp. B 225]
MKAYLKRVVNDSTGTSALEMGLICSLVVLTMLGALQGFGNATQSTWETINNESAKAVQKAPK